MTTEMTDSRAAEVLAAHNEWRRYDGETGVPGAPVMGDPAEIGRAIDHVVSRLRALRAALQPVATGVEAVELTVCCGREECGGECGNEWRGMEWVRKAGQPPAEAHCATCSCVPGMTPAVRFDTTPAEKEGAVRDHLIRMGWTPPAEAQPAAVALSREELDTCRQWFDSVQDTNGGYLTPDDYVLAEKLYRSVGMRVPDSIGRIAAQQGGES